MVQSPDAGPRSREDGQPLYLRGAASGWDGGAGEALVCLHSPFLVKSEKKTTAEIDLGHFIVTHLRETLEGNQSGVGRTAAGRMDVLGEIHPA